MTTNEDIARPRALTIVAIAIWLAAAVVAGLLGWVNRPLEAPLVLLAFVVVPIAGFVPAYVASPAFHAFANSLSLTVLVGAHLWRFVGLFFVIASLTGSLPKGFGYPEGVGDVIAAMGALLLLTFDKLTSVHYSGTHHEEDQPVHLQVHTEVCHTICGEEYGHPCVRFCPASVYEMVDNGHGGRRLQINASNCVHCKTCDIMDPYGVITWVAPEGGEGPQYDGM